MLINLLGMSATTITPFEFLVWYISDPLRFILLAGILAAVSYPVYRFVIQPLYTLISSIASFVHSKRVRRTIIQITPPAHIDKSPEAMQQLFSILQQALISKSGWSWLWKHKDTVSLEIIASHDDGLRYLIYAPKSKTETIQRHFSSHIPNIRFTILDDAQQPIYSNQTYSISEIHQSRHYAYPLQSHKKYSEEDLAAYIAGAMTKLEPDEYITLQSIVTPYSSTSTTRLRNKLMRDNDAVLDNKVKYFITGRWRVWATALVLGLLTQNIWVFIISAFLLFLISISIKGRVQLTSAQQQVVNSLNEKLSQSLFTVDLRLLVNANSRERCLEIIDGIQSSLALLNVPGFQSLHIRKTTFRNITFKYRLFKFWRRLPSLFPLSNKLSAEELANIYHFPYGDIKTEGVIRSASRTLPTPVAMRTNEFDVIVGKSNHHGASNYIGLSAAERERHVFMIGGTGNGKTTLLQYAIVQDIQNGKGVAVIDPHGDMAELLLNYIPEERINDVVYFNPDDLSHPIGLNILELTPGLEDDKLLREKDLVTESVISIFRKIFSEDDSGGHRVEYVLRNAIQTALTIEDATLFTVYDLLNDPAYRKKIITTLENEDLKNFWKNELGKAGGFQQVKMMAGITAKIGRFLFSASAKRILEQPRSTINFDEILDGKILICNLSKGLLGEDTSELFGIAMLAKIQLAALRRARLKKEKRKSFYLYVDEFQNFATVSFTQMLSEARKYKLFLTMAEQSTSQQDDQKMVNIILANVGTVICFRSGNPADERLVLPLFKPHIDQGEIANLPSYSFYMRVSSLKTEEPFSGETIVLEDESNPDIAEKVILASRKHYAISKKKVTKEKKPVRKTKKSKEAKNLPKESKE